MKKFMIVNFDNGDKYKIPTEIIFKDCLDYYIKESEDETSEEVEKQLREDFEDSFIIEDWAFNNMNWEDVEKYAIPLEYGEKNMEELWVNCQNVEFED